MMFLGQKKHGLNRERRKYKCLGVLGKERED